MTSPRVVGLFVIAFLASALAGCAVYTEHGSGRGEAPGQEKVTLCHKGKKTLQVAAAAAKAHYGHGDTPGACR
jgi:hypothetical protein